MFGIADPIHGFGENEKTLHQTEDRYQTTHDEKEPKDDEDVLISNVLTDLTDDNVSGK